MRPSLPRSGPLLEALASQQHRSVLVRASSSSRSSSASNAPLFRRAAFDVAVVGAGAPAATAAATSARAGFRTLWLDGGPPSGVPDPSVFHRRPSHAPARLACSEARLVALAAEGLEAWRSLDESVGRRGSGRRSSSSTPVLSEGGCLDLASADANNGGGMELLEACAEASREAGVRGVRLLAASEIEAALSGSGNGGGSGGSGLPLLSSTRSVSGLLLPSGGSLSFSAADEAAAADAASAGVERWGPRFALAGWRDAGGGSRFELRGERDVSATTAAGMEAAPLAEVERLVLVPPERGLEEFLACFGLMLDGNSGAGLVDAPWCSVGGSSSSSSSSSSNSNSPSFSQLTPCVLCHGLSDRNADPGAPRGGSFEQWLFVPSNGGGSFGGSVSVPPALVSRASLSASAISEAVAAAREAFVNSDEFDGEEETVEEFLFSPFAKDAEAVAAAASRVLRPLSGSPLPRLAFASRTLVTADGAPLCGWAPLEVSVEEEEEEGVEEGRGGGGSIDRERQREQRRQQERRRTKAKTPSFGALGSQSGRVLVLSPAAGRDPSGPSHGLLAVPVLAHVSADLLSGFSSSAVRGPLAAEALSPTRKGAALRCVQLTRDSWEGSK